MENKLVFEKIFGRNFGDGSNASFLEKIAKEHLYFSPAQFFLLQQADTASASYNKLAARTAILFNNPHWLNFQLKQTNAPAATEQPFENLEVPVTVMTTATTIPENTPDPEITPTPQNEVAPVKSGQGLSTEAMLFEPMHMVDYFASQGIKLSEEAQTADKLGKQLKSFTEWLKTMKKVHTGSTTSAEAQGDPTDKNIQSLAEKSNTDDEILTESMAEVFAKQGKAGRAMEVYQKLSLLNPSKSAYFAAKIEYLKGK